MMMMMTIIVSLIISLFIVEDDCPLIALIGGKADISDREYKIRVDFDIPTNILVYTAVLTLCQDLFKIKLCFILQGSLYCFVQPFVSTCGWWFTARTKV